jgi:hypothetical protein
MIVTEVMGFETLAIRKRSFVLGGPPSARPYAFRYTSLSSFVIARESPGTEYFSMKAVITSSTVARSVPDDVVSVGESAHAATTGRRTVAASLIARAPDVGRRMGVIKCPPGIEPRTVEL